MELDSEGCRLRTLIIKAFACGIYFANSLVGILNLDSCFVREEFLVAFFEIMF